MKEIVFVIQRVGWEYNDSGYDARSEGGETMRAYRNRERAEGALQEMEQERREGRDEFWGYDLSAKLIRETPLNYLNGLEETYADGSEPIFFEIIEVELEDEE